MEPLVAITDPPPLPRQAGWTIPLSEKDASYASMTKIGSIEMRLSASGELHVLIEGFEFRDLATCRSHSVRAMAWARDVLAAQVALSSAANCDVMPIVG